MKKILGLSVIAFVLFSCQGSKKGAWTDEEKDKAIKWLKKNKMEVNDLGKYKDQFTDCFVEKLENSSENFEATSDANKTMAIIECMNPIVQKNNEELNQNLK